MSVALVLAVAAGALPAQTPGVGLPAARLTLQLLEQGSPIPAPPAKAGKDDDFDLLPPEKPPDAEAVVRQRQLSQALALRRTLLRLHQYGGFATLGAMTATAIVGQLNYDDKYGGGGDTGKYRSAHQILAYGTTGVFAATGLLALFAPSPFEKPLRLDTATLHKTSMLVATAGLVAQVVLGIVTAGSEGSISQRDFARAHQIVGYVTLAATATGFAVLTFP
jgi:hypothetical protein